MACTNGTDYHDGTGTDFGCKIRSISFSAYCTPNRRPEPIRIEETEKQWHRDIPAYQGLVKNGIQPRQIDGCGDVAQSDADKFEIESGMVIPKERKTATTELLTEMGHIA